MLIHFEEGCIISADFYFLLNIMQVFYFFYFFSCYVIQSPHAILYETI